MAETKIKRSIITIDEDKCNGCGLCVTACAEGAIEIREGKARLVSETYCDGLGACLKECPQDAIRMVEREAEAYDPAVVEEHLSGKRSACPPVCPGSMTRVLNRNRKEKTLDPTEPAERPSLLGNWPVQLSLVPPQAPYLQGADLVIAADCAPFAYRDFHSSFLPDSILLIGCPKLDDTDFYLDKLTEIFSTNPPSSVEVVYLEVPCCGGLVRLVEEARRKSGREFPLTMTKIGIDGEREIQGSTVNAK